MEPLKIVGAAIASPFLIFAAPFATFANPSPANPTAVLADVSLAVEAVAAHLEGTMDTTGQAATDPNFVGVQMTTCRITITDPTESTSTATSAVPSNAFSSAPANVIFLYQEQALSANLSAPYRQRFLQLTPGNNNRIDSHTFKPESPEQWTGLCDQAETERQVPATTLGDVVCTVSLRASSLDGFVGSTPTEGCVANVRGAVRIRNVVVLHADGMDTWDRGFDADGNQVWGAEDIPYQYRWRTTE